VKVLFINKFLDKHTIYRVPLGILYLAATVKNRHIVQICDPKRRDVNKIIETFKPDIIAYSLRTGFHKYYLDLNKKLKTKYNFISLFGGPHATFFPEIINLKEVDIIGLSECEKGFSEFLVQKRRKDN